MSTPLDHFDTDLQCEDIEFADVGPREEDLLHRTFCRTQEEQDEFNEMCKERRKEAMCEGEISEDEPDWKEYV